MQESAAHNSMTSRRVAALRRANKALGIAAAVVVVYLVVVHFSAAPADDAVPDYVESDFSIQVQASDINPGRDHILYTNYACPYCAAFYFAETDIPYTQRILLLDKEGGRFATQETVSPYMLKLYREDPDAYSEMERWLFSNQDDWVWLDEEGVLETLNARSGRSWGASDLETELAECLQIEDQAPGDLEFVPSLYSEGKLHNGYVLGLVGD